MIKGSCPFPAIGWERAAFALFGNPNHSSDLLHKDNLLPPPAKRGIMRNEFRQPDEQNMRQLLHQHPEDLPGLILRLAWLQGLSREEIVALKWAQVDFQERSLFLEDRTVPLEEETAGCLAARFENGGAVSPYVVISDKFREPLRSESVSRIARNALTAGGLPQLQLKDLRRDYFFRQLEQHDWPYAVRVSGLSVSTFQACFAGDTPHKKRSTQAGQQFDEFRLWQVLQKEDSSAAGIALWMSWQMGVQGKELVNLTWDQVDLERGLLHLPERDMLLTNAVRRLLEKVQKVRSPGEDPHVLLSPQSRRPMDLARLSKVVQTALIRGGLENITLRDIRAAGGQREDDQTLLEWTRAHGSITRRDVMALLNLSDTAAYLRLRRLVGRRELEQVGKKYYLPGTVVPEEKQWEVISAYLQEAGFAYCQDVAELLHVGKRKTAGILRRMVRDGQLLQFEKRYYLAKQPGQKQIQ